MTYPKTIIEVNELEEEFSISGLNPNDYLFITQQLKTNIDNHNDNPSKDFKAKMLSSMKEVRKILQTSQTINP